MFKALVTCCCPPAEDRDEDHGDENTRLIRNGGTQGGNRWGGAGGYSALAGNGGGRDQRNGPASTPADDEQAILARIQQDIANDVIDVSTTEAHTVEPREYMERARKYNQQLSSQITAATLQQATAGGTGSTPTSAVGSAGKRSSAGGYLSSSGGASGPSGNRCLLSDSSQAPSGSGNVPLSDKTLSAPPVYPDDIAMIKQLSSQIARVVTDVRVEHKEDLVVQFAPS